MNNVLILGSGRSGTSMITGCLVDAGYTPGDNYLGENQSNPKGFFEDREVNQINEKILDTYHVRIPEWIRKILIPSYPFYNARWLARISPSTLIESEGDVEKRITQAIAARPFCYKDPRFSYTLPVWKPYLPENTKFICIFRNPLDTAESIVKECESSPALHPLKMNRVIAMEVWRRMHQHILKNYKGDVEKKNWIFLHFNQVLKGERLDELSGMLGVPVSSSFSDAKLNRSRSSQSADLMDGGLSELYASFCALAKYEL